MNGLNRLRIGDTQPVPEEQGEEAESLLRTPLVSDNRNHNQSQRKESEQERDGWWKSPRVSKSGGRTSWTVVPICDSWFRMPSAACFTEWRGSGGHGIHLCGTLEVLPSRGNTKLMETEEMLHLGSQTGTHSNVSGARGVMN